MTKTVRIENADTSSHKIRIRIQELYQVSPGSEEQEWKDVEVLTVNNPTDMHTTYIHAHKRLIVEEYN